MKDRARIANGKSSKLMCPAEYAPADFATFLTDLKAGNVYVDINPNNSTGADAGVTEVGTPLNKANLLTDATAQGFGFDATENPTINDVLNRIAVDYIEGTLTAGQTSLTLTDDRIKTTSVYDIYTDTYGVSPLEVTVSSGSMVLTFASRATNLGVKVRVF